MTNQEIIERFETDKVKASLDIAGGVFVQTDLAHEIVKALRFQPCEDCISRQAVEKITWEEASYTDALNVLTEVREKVRALPPVTPQYTEAEIQKMQELEQAEIQKAYELGKAEMQPCEDCISRQAVLNILKDKWSVFSDANDAMQESIDTIEALRSVTPQPKARRCKDCKHFEYDSVAKVDGVPLIVAHEICSRWGDGCKTSEEGYCFLFEPKMQEVEE